MQLLSDVHLEFHVDAGQSFVESLDPRDVDVLVLAGDIAVGSGIPSGLGLFCRHFSESTVVYVHGNHEFYGSTRVEVATYTRAVSDTYGNFVWLDADLVEIHGRRFIGGPLWFRRPADDAPRRNMADFAQIRDYETWVYQENDRMLSLLDSELGPDDVVITHHLPSFRSVAPRHSGSPLNAFFVCDVEELIRERQPLLWMHGHTHVSVDAHLGETHVLCNPFGYAGWDTNPRFDDRLVVDI